MLRIQKYLYYLLFLITPFIMFSGTSELFEFNKMIFIYILTFSILAVWIMRMVAQGRILFKKTPFDIFIAIFFISQLLSTLFSIDRHVSIFGYYGRFNGGILSLVSYLILYYSFAEYVFVHSDGMAFLRNILKITLFSSTAVIIWGLPGKIGRDLSCLVFSGKLDNSCWTAQFDPAARMFSTLGQPNWLGAYLAIVFFIALYFYLTSKKLTYLPVLALNLLGIFFTNSRSAVLSVMIVTAGVFLWSIFMKKRIAIPGLRSKLIILAVLFVSFTLIFKTGIGQVDRYLEIATYRNLIAKKEPAPKTPPATAKQPAALNITESLDIRKIVWKGAADLGFQYPLFGTGVETFAYSYYFVRPVEHNLTSEWDYLYNKAHNEYLNYFATTGYTGIISYLLFIGSTVTLGLYWATFVKDQANGRNISLLQVGLTASFLTILITNFVGFSTTTINLYFFMIPAALYFLHTVKKKDPALKNQVVKKQSSVENGGVFSYLVVIVGLLFFLQYFVTYWLADTKYALAENYAKSNDYESAVSLLNSSLKMYNDHVYEDKISYYMANLAFIAAYQKDMRLANELMKASDSYNRKSLNASPQNILYWKTRIKNQYLYYQITLDKKHLDEGIAALDKSVTLSPTDAKLPYFQSTYLSLIWDEEKNPDKKTSIQAASLEAAERSIKLKKDYLEGYYLKAQLLRKYGRNQEARETYEYILKNISPGNEAIKKELEAMG